MKYFILLAFVVAALADDQASDAHKLKAYKGYNRYGGHYGHKGHHRGRRDVQEQSGLVEDEAPGVAAADQVSAEHRHHGYGGSYGGYYGGYQGGVYGSYYPTTYNYGYPYGGQQYGGHRWRRSADTETAAAPLLSAAPLATAEATDLSGGEHRHHHYHGQSYAYPSYGYGYQPNYGYSNYGYNYPSYGYGYPSQGYAW